jgi:DNA-binding transcriptional ArsR family regulator
MTNTDKHVLFQKQAVIIKAMAHPLRIAIVNFLKDGEKCVCDIARHVRSERSNVSRHLSSMVNAGLLEYRKEGRKVIYRLKTPCIFEFLSCVSFVLKQQTTESKNLLQTL